MKAERTWPTEDGSEYLIAKDALDWEGDTTFRLSHLVTAEMDKIGGPQKRSIARGDMIGCYLRALRTLTLETEREAVGDCLASYACDPNTGETVFRWKDGK